MNSTSKCPLAHNEMCSILNAPCTSVMITPCINLQAAYHKGFSECYKVLSSQTNRNNE